MRHFIISVAYRLNTRQMLTSFGLHSTGYLFPSALSISAKFLEENPGSHNITILSISEVSEDDYNAFFGISNDEQTTQAQK